MSSSDYTILYVASAGIVILLLFIYFLRSWRQRRLREIQSPDSYSPKSDRAHNQIVTARALAEKLEREGADVDRARELLNEAEHQLEQGEVDLALGTAQSARVELQHQRDAAVPKAVPGGPQRIDKSAEPTPPAFRDVSRRVGDREADEVSATGPATARPAASDDSKGEAAQGAVTAGSDDEGPQTKTVPKNYLESRFQLKLIQEELDREQPAKGATPEFKEAQRLLGQAQECFDRKDYTESLRLALRARRRLGSSGLDTVPLSPGTTIEAPPVEPTAAVLRSSAPPTQAVPDESGGARPTTVTCARCHRSNPAENRFCRGCGAPLTVPLCPRCQKPVAPDDGFCGACGAPITGA